VHCDGTCVLRSEWQALHWCTCAATGKDPAGSTAGGGLLVEVDMSSQLEPAHALVHHHGRGYRGVSCRSWFLWSMTS
jgi:hypothetical protein